MHETAPFAELEFIRARLNALSSRRERRPLTATESREYRDLCLRELSLLAGTPTPRRPRRMR